MHSSKVIKLLRLLTPEEFKQLDKFIQSPFFNSNKRIIAFYQYLKKHYPDFDSPRLDKQTVFKKLFPGKKFNYNILGNLISTFAHLIEQYLAQVQYQKKPYSARKMLIEAYGERNDFESFEKNTHILVEELQALPYRNGDTYRELYLLLSSHLAHPNIDRYSLTTKDFENVMRQLDLFYTVEKLQFSCDLLAREHIFSEQHTIWFLEELLHHFTHKATQDTVPPLIKMYMATLSLQQTQNDHAYHTLKETFLANLAHISSQNQLLFLQQLLNYVVPKGNSGQLAFKQESLALYKIGLAHKMLFVKHQLPAGTYTNIAYIAAILGDYTWCANFIETYKPFINEKAKVDAHLLCCIYLSYYRKEYDKVIDLVNNMPFSQVHFQYRAKYILLKAYFEKFLQDKSYEQMLINQTHAFEKYIRRIDFLHPHKIQSYLKFAQLLRQFTNHIASFDWGKAQKEKLQKNIIAQDYLVGKPWLLTQLQRVQ